MSKEQPKYFVWSENPYGGRVPKFVHDSEASAMREADRLAWLNPGQRFYVLKSIGHAVKQDTVWVDHVEDVEVPF